MKLDLVQILIDQYRERVRPSIESELTDIARDLGVSPRAILEAMTVAVDVLEEKRKA